jgi:FkbM family methyltransferase
MRFLEGAITLAKTPGMPRAYAQWLYGRAVGRGPYVYLGPGVRVGSNWVNFSEFWSNQTGNGRTTKINHMTASIRDLCQSCLEKAGTRSVAIDAGANVGMFTAAFAAAGFTEVHSFEPVPATFARLEANIALNRFGQKVRLNNLGLGDKEALVNIDFEEKSPATAHIVGDGTPGSSPVRITTLDRYAELNGIDRIDFLKIDTEGYEAAVFRGAARLLREKRILLILFEWCPELLDRTGSGAEDLYRTIVDAGYSLHEISSAGEIGGPLGLNDVQSASWENLIATPAAGA